ncbi:hypothetical protein FHP25_04625 [Vineibacter terrae]|uniref:Uncharacterized protein n=1 Tax=Vineibacter terrae TaxID=2586908 RepID=A0A5C8PTC3_9HYPH|nr:hypothetical protein [Vineibacter terrae]TXL80322.1 hypothetical protein FHP25_04625 [Vineibacter terrae]
MPTCPSTLPLDWPALCAHVRRRQLPDHRGELPPRRADMLPLDAPLAVAVCAQFGQRHRFATEHEAEIWRWIGPRALGVCNRWQGLRHDREDVRVAVGTVRHWRSSGDARQADLARRELIGRWARYRRGMRTFATQLDGVRRSLAPPVVPAPVAVPLLQAAE